jgi:hypothetical protein
MRARWFSGFLFVSLVLSSAQAQKTNLKHVPPPPRKAVNQEMYAPYWTLEPGWHTDIELRNNRKSDLTVTPALRTASGTEIPLAPVTIPPDEVTVLDLMQVLSASHPELIGKTGSYGSIALRYTSPSQHNIYAGTMIHYEGKPVAYHFDAAGSEPMFNEGSRESVWWLPNDTTDAHLIIANAGAKPVEAVVSLFAQSGKAYSRHVSLAARQMARFSIRELVTAAGFTDTYGGLRVTVAQGAESVFVSHLAFDLTTGFSALLRVFENSPEEEPHDVTLRAPMLALSNPDPVLSLPQGTVLQPKVFLRNTMSSPLAVKGELRWRNASTQGVLRLPDTALNANETRIVDLSAMQHDGTIPKDASWGYLKLNYSGRYGDLVAIAASYDASLAHGLQTPFSDIVASHWVGSKWYADDVRNSLLTAGNDGDKTTNVLFALLYNGGKSKYEIQQSLAPGEQMFVSTAKIIGSQVPDKNGSTIPPDVKYGSYSIRNLDDPLGTYLFEGKLTIDTKYGYAFHGCGYCCSPAGPPGPSPDPFSQLVYDVWANSLWGYDVCDDNDYDVTSSAYSWWSSDTTVMTIDTTGVSTGVGAGSPFANSSIWMPQGNRLKCPYKTYYPVSSGSVKPTISGPNTVWWFNGQNPNSATWPTQITLSASASGTWAATSGSSYVHLSSTSGSSITVQGTGTFSQSANDVSMTVTVNGVTSNPFTLTSKGPKQLSNPTNFSEACTGSGEQGWHYYKTYRVLDNFNNVMTSMPVSEGLGAPVTDRPDNLTFPAPIPTGGTTDASTGNYTDSIFVCPVGTVTPMPENYTDGSGTSQVDHIAQAWCAGSSTSGSSCTGAPAQNDTMKRYLDHGTVTIP